jgi:hypothetical protein
VRLGIRALDILIALTERAGEVVGKDELVAAYGPTPLSRRAVSNSKSARCGGH